MSTLIPKVDIDWLLSHVHLVPITDIKIGLSEHSGKASKAHGYSVSFIYPSFVARIALPSNRCAGSDAMMQLIVRFSVRLTSAHENSQNG